LKLFAGLSADGGAAPGQVPPALPGAGQEHGEQ